ncbi:MULTISPECIES: hypothetical protein [unclassified Frondihabitans]|uniref:DoxX family protein n=1 Tax=unclassified Frondihabitans TaxID=2626248 RepID=UPI000F4F5947|nr:MULTISPECIES: hypothetical protein [unclassified Frondihabitans]RPE74887.1 putative membrane protein [Frondihabitans sp. PhB153]RPF04131.1 putative membrane protein [Frondihabitans sp. PhB161]
MPRQNPRRTALILSTGLAVSGALHFARPKTFDGIVPESLPGEPRTWTLVSGGAELACAAALAIPRTRSVGGILAAALFVAVFPANVKMARDALRSRRAAPRRKVIAIVRLPLQVPLVLLALQARRG